MKYELVLQFRGDSIEDYDTMIALEDALIETLRSSARVDGHDMGSNERNIFIFTPNPRQTFERAKTVLERENCLHAATAAYRPIDGEDYIVLWPEGFKEVFTIR
jgi:hypothetical protein